MTLCLHSKRILLLLCLQDTCTSSASPLLPKTSLADIQKVKKPLILSKLLIENDSQGFGEAIAASMFSAPGLVRTTAAPNLMPPMLPMLRLPGYTHPPFHPPSPYSPFDPLYRLAPMSLAPGLPGHLQHPSSSASSSRPSCPTASGNDLAPPSSSVARTREGRYPSG